MSKPSIYVKSTGSEIVYSRFDGNFGLSVSNIELRSLSDTELIRLLYELYHNRFLVSRLNYIDQATYVSFAKRLGELIPMSRDEQFPEVGYITNRDVDTQRTMMGAAHWHTDQSFRSTVSNITLLYSVHAPITRGKRSSATWLLHTTHCRNLWKTKSISWSLNIVTVCR